MSDHVEIERLRAENGQQRALLEAKSLRNWQNETEIETLQAENEDLRSLKEQAVAGYCRVADEAKTLRANALTKVEALALGMLLHHQFGPDHPISAKLQRIASQNLGSDK